MKTALLIVTLLIPCTVAAEPASGAADLEFMPLFNGRDLTGWVPVNVAPTTFSVREGMIVSTGIPTGTLRSERMYENFVLELEWRHLQPRGNAGLFVWADPIPAVGGPFSRGIEVQILDGRNTETYTSHGDIFSIWGARMVPDRPHPRGAERCLPLEHRCRPAPEWNHYRVTCRDGTITLEVNGKAVSGGRNCTPRKGYLCLEAEGSECHFRNLKIHEFPSTDPKPDEVALPAQGFQALYTGRDLSGWRMPDDNPSRWKAADWTLVQIGQGKPGSPLLTERAFGDFELICDWRWTGKPRTVTWPKIRSDGTDDVGPDGKPVLVSLADAGETGIVLRGSDGHTVKLWCRPQGSGEVAAVRADSQRAADLRARVTPRSAADRPLGEWNRSVITLVENHLTVRINGVFVVERAELPDLPASGPVGLESLGASVEFSNVLIRELPSQRRAQ